MIEPPYGLIADLLRKGQVVPFLGAGVNFGNRPKDAPWDENTREYLPSGPELSRLFAGKCSFPSTDPHDRADLAKVTSYFVEASARRRLRENLTELFDHDYEPCDIHSYLAEVPTPLLILTTNYDDLIERAFLKSGRPFDVVVHPTDRQEYGASVLWWRYGEAEPHPIHPRQLQADLERRTVIYKMHGTVDRTMRKWHSFVITEEDYVDFLSRMMNNLAVPAQFIRHLRSRHFLFLGYGLRDWNFRVLLKSIRGIPPEGTADADPENVVDVDPLTSWAIQYKPSELEEQLWGWRRVKIYSLDLNDFVRGLKANG